MTWGAARRTPTVAAAVKMLKTIKHSRSITLRIGDINLTIKQRKVAFIIIEDNKNQNVILQGACTVSASLISVQILTVSSK